MTQPFGRANSVDDDGELSPALKAQLEESWRCNASRWTQLVRNQEIASRVSVTDAAIVRAVLRHRPVRVLDLGCGEGWLCRALAQHEVSCLGIDASKNLIDLAEQKGGAEYRALSYGEIAHDPLTVDFRPDLMVANFSLLDDTTPELLSALSSLGSPSTRLVIQTVHPLGAQGEYREGWRMETFDGFGGEGWHAMPWFFRTLQSWVEALGARWRLEHLEEPAEEGAKAPSSLLMTAALSR